MAETLKEHEVDSRRRAPVVHRLWKTRTEYDILISKFVGRADEGKFEEREKDLSCVKDYTAFHAHAS